VLFQKENPINEECKELETINGRFLNLINEIEKLETEIHRTYMAGHRDSGK